MTTSRIRLYISLSMHRRLMRGTYFEHHKSMPVALTSGQIRPVVRIVY